MKWLPQPTLLVEFMQSWVLCPQPMEIDQIAQYDAGKGKMKGKGKEGKGKHGKGKDGKGKHSKGKNQSGGKYGKGKGKDKGSNDGKGKNLDNNQCSYCLKFGHWRRDCHKLKDDQKHNRVRQIEEVVDDGGQAQALLQPQEQHLRMLGLSVLHLSLKSMFYSRMIHVKI